MCHNKHIHHHALKYPLLPIIRYDCGEFYTNDGKKHNELWVKEDTLKHGGGCACCGTYATVEKINSIKATISNYEDYGVSEEDAKRYRPNNKNIKIKYVCNNCGKTHEKTIRNIFRNNHVVCDCSNWSEEKKNYNIFL